MRSVDILPSYSLPERMAVKVMPIPYALTEGVLTPSVDIEKQLVLEISHNLLVDGPAVGVVFRCLCYR